MLSNFISKKKKYFICSIDNYVSKEDVSRFKNKNVFLNRETLPKIKKNEYYLYDLIGFKILSDNNDNFGFISNFHHFGAGLVVELKRNNDFFYLPFEKNFLINIDKKNKMVRLNIPSNYLER